MTAEYKGKIAVGIGTVLVLLALTFGAVHSFIMYKGPDGSFVDWLGFPIPMPKTRLMWIPGLGDLIEAIATLCSLHGLVGLAIFWALMGPGAFLVYLWRKN